MSLKASVGHEAIVMRKMKTKLKNYRLFLQNTIRQQIKVHSLIITA